MAWGMTEKVHEWLLKGASLIAAAVLPWGAWATVQINDSATKSDLKELKIELRTAFQTEAPYLQDKNMIMAMLSDYRATNEKLAATTNELTKAINNNTTALVELQTIVKGGYK